jgi:hypothetical protein
MSSWLCRLFPTGKVMHLRFPATGQARFMFIGLGYKLNKFCAAACIQFKAVRALSVVRFQTFNVSVQ